MASKTSNDAHIGIAEVEPEDSAGRRVLGSPELLDVVFSHCYASAMYRLSLVNRFFEDASAPRMYRCLYLNHFGWMGFGTGTNNRAPTPRQIKYLSSTRALLMTYTELVCDVSSCSFAGVEVVGIDFPIGVSTAPGYDSDTDPETIFNDEKMEAKQVAVNMAKCPNLRPSTIVDEWGITIPVNRAGVMVVPPTEDEVSSDSVNHHATRLVTRHDLPNNASIARLVDAAAAAAVGVKQLLKSFYPNLSEIVFLQDDRVFGYKFLEMLLALVDNGYKVVLAGYQERNRHREHVKKMVLALDHEARPDLDKLVDNLVDRVHKTSLKNYRASPNGRISALVWEPYDGEFEREENWCRSWGGEQSTMPHDES